MICSIPTQQTGKVHLRLVNDVNIDHHQINVQLTEMNTKSSKIFTINNW